MPSLLFQAPTVWRFGVGVLGELGTAAQRFGSRALLLTGRQAMRRLGVLARAEDLLRRAEVASVLFDEVSANPRTDEVERAAERGRAEGVDLVIGLGGGSVLDAAKATAARLALGRPVAALLAESVPVERTLPVIAVPTTAGTGSELSRGAILTDHERRFKGGLRGDGLFPALALVDPELSMTMPEEVARLTGFDVFTHAVETYFSRKSHPGLEALSLEAVAIVRDCLIRPRAEWTARECGVRMAYASSLMGINLGNASTCLPHRMQYAIGALTDTAHPAGLAALYPAWFEQVARAAPVKARRLLEVLYGVEEEVTAAVERPADAMTGLLRAAGVERSLAELGVVTEEEMRWCIDHVTGASDVDPCYRGPETVAQIFLSARALGC